MNIHNSTTIDSITMETDSAMSFFVSDVTMDTTSPVTSLANDATMATVIESQPDISMKSERHLLPPDVGVIGDDFMRTLISFEMFSTDITDRYGKFS